MTMLRIAAAEDKPAPLPEVDKVLAELRAANIEFEYDLYSGAGHGFSGPHSKPDERANTLSIQATQRFLKESFGI